MATREERRVRFKKTSFQNLLLFKDAAELVGMEYWIEHGLLLGLHRSNDMIGGDERDVDVCVPVEDAWLIDEVIAIVSEQRLVKRKTNRAKDGYIIGCALRRDSCMIDIHVADRRGGIVYYPMHRIKETGEYGVFVYPIGVFEALGTIEWNGIVFPCPQDIEWYLEERYGSDWRLDKKAEGLWTNVRDTKNNPCLQIWDKETLGDKLYSKKI